MNDLCLTNIHMSVCGCVCFVSEDMTVEEKILSYNRANRAVAILCNHQRAAPKTFEKSMQLLQEKVRHMTQHTRVTVNIVFIMIERNLSSLMTLVLYESQSTLIHVVLHTLQIDSKQR